MASTSTAQVATTDKPTVVIEMGKEAPHPAA